MDTNALQTIGFEEKEARIYLELLKLGTSPASKIASQLEEDRTTIYYGLIKMVEKGYVSETILSNVKNFTATPPAQIQALLEERTQLFKTQLPLLQKLMSEPTPELTVELRKGKAALRHLYRDSLEVGGEILGLGTEDNLYLDMDPAPLNQYYKEAQEKGIKERLITYPDAKTVDHPITQYRYIPREYVSPSHTVIYGDKVVFMIWEPTLHLIHIKSKEFSESFRAHFEIVWKSARKDK